jgi:hypothetical protein
MTLKCYDKPNRTKPRFFSSCDAARIARNVVIDTDQTPEQVLACIAKGMGFTHISLSRQRSVESGINLSKGAITPLLIILKKTVISLGNRFPRLLRFIAPLIEAVDALSNAIQLIFDQPDQEKVDDAIAPGKCTCKDDISKKLMQKNQSRLK